MELQVFALLEFMAKQRNEEPKRKILMTKKNNNNQGTNPLKGRIYIRLNYNLSAYLLQNIMIIVYAPCITGL